MFKTLKSFRILDVYMRERHDDVERAEVEIENYLPAMPPLSITPGRVERFVTSLFRRRGGLRPVTRRDCR